MSVAAPERSAPHDATKPRTGLVRRITSRLRGTGNNGNNARKDSREGSQAAHGLGLANTLVAKGQREQALRERGLLPPLEPRDLSAQEGAQDRLLDSQSPRPPEESRNQNTGPSAADLIRQEWLGKHTTPDPTLAPDSLANQTGEPSSSSAQDTTLNPYASVSAPLGTTSKLLDSPLPPLVEVTSCSEAPPTAPAASSSQGHADSECDPAASIATPSLSAESHSVSVHSSHLAEQQHPGSASKTRGIALVDGFGTGSEVTSEPEIFQPSLKESVSLPATISSTRHNVELDEGAGRKEGKTAVGSSFSNLKRSLTRSKTKREPRIPGSTSNPEGLARSKSLSSFARKQHLAPPPDAPRRTPRAPVVHSLSTIAQEAEAIEDEESRRLSEMCFMD